MTHVALNGLDLYYETHGSGEPLMLVAGLASDCLSWQPILEGLAQHYQVIAFDNRGCGRTRPMDTEITVSRMADDCLALADHLGISSMNLLGHSMGGFIAMECALRRPSAIKRLILAGTSARRSKRNVHVLSDWATYLEAGMDPELWFRNIFYWVFAERFFENDEALKEAIRFELEYPYPIDPVGFRRQVEAIRKFDLAEAVSAIKAKTLVIAGKEDLLFTPEDCANLALEIPGAQYRVIKNAAHAFFTENPRDCVDCVLDFLREGR